MDTDWRALVQALVDGIEGQLGGKDEQVLSHNLLKAYRDAKTALG